jgi:hypothetical protein
MMRIWTTRAACLLLGVTALGTACGGDGAGDGESDPSKTGSSSTEGDNQVGGDGDGVDVQPGQASCVGETNDVGSNVLRRLSRIEYQLTMQDLFHLAEPPSIELVPEDVLQEGFTSFSEVQTITAQHLRAYWDTAVGLFDDLAAEPARRDLVIGCDTTSSTCLRDFATRMGRLAFRRDLTTEELDALTLDALTHGVDLDDQFRYLGEALLISPQFLFRVEVGEQAEGLSTLTAAELASKLSFTIWGRSPSVELLDQAKAGALATPLGLEAVVANLLDDPKAKYYYSQFFRQWLGYAKLRAPADIPADWSDDLMPLLMQETDSLVDEFAWTEGAHLFDALIANHTTLTPKLQAFYGLTANSAGHVEFSSGDPRENAGILGHASILSQKSDGDKISVRGNWLRRTFICEELEIPPGLAETLGDQLVGLTSTEIIAERNSEASCRKCHSKIDPIGVGLAQFDATGRFDETVDLSSYPVLPGFPDAEEPAFASLAELAQKIRAMPQTAQCLAERAFVYTQGRHTDDHDTCTFEAASKGFSDEGGSFSALLRQLVLDGGFRLRRAPSPVN